MNLARLAVATAFALSLAVASAAADAPATGGALAKWDQARVTSLAKNLVGATRELYDAFFKQPKPTSTPNAVRDYERLKRELRRVKNEARGLAADLERGETREETQHAYESLMVTVNWARERARSLFTTQDVNERADLVRDLLGKIGAYYEAAAPAPTKAGD